MMIFIMTMKQVSYIDYDRLFQDGHCYNRFLGLLNFQDETYPITSIQLAIYRQTNFIILVEELKLHFTLCEVLQCLKITIVPQRPPSFEKMDRTTRHNRKGQTLCSIAHVSSSILEIMDGCAIDEKSFQCFCVFLLHHQHSRAT